MPLRRFLSLVESRPRFVYPSRLLADAVGADAAGALCSAGVLVPDGRATWYPCGRGRKGCPRVIGDAGLSCSRTPAECPEEAVDPAELGQHTLCEDALTRLLQELFGVAGQLAAADPRGEPLLLGSAAGTSTWLWLRPREPDFSFWMRERDEVAERTVALVPTPARIYAETFDRHGPGQHASVVHLDRALSLVGGSIVRAAADEPALRLPWKPAHPVERPQARVHVPAGTPWGQIAIEYVHDDLVAIRVGDEWPVRLTSAELGMTKDTNGAMDKQWELLLALCRGNGRCTRGAVGAASMEVLKTRAARLGDRLCCALGMPERPLHVSSREQMVWSDFRAAPETRREASRRKL
jgi:hypothetical protein